MSTCHEGEFKCTECAYCFKTSLSLNRHITQSHKERKFHCSACQTSYVNSADRRAHYKTKGHARNDVRGQNGGLQQATYWCQPCNKEFGNEAKLPLHNSVKYGENTEPLPASFCSTCKKSYTNRASLKYHLQTPGHREALARGESGSEVVLPNWCSTCRQSYNTMYELEALYKHPKHLNNLTKENSDKMQQEAINSQTDRRAENAGIEAFKCTVCLT
jgi:hypothetical protein